jgi:Spy/CpxP family protein refolding chaperone
MLKNFRRGVFLTAKIWISFLVVASAQEGGPPEPPQEPPPPEKREQLRRDIENMRIWKMTQYLELSTEQSTKFFPIFNDFQSKREELEQEQAEMMRRLAELVESEGEQEGEMKNLISGVEKNRRKMVDLVDEFRREAGRVLSLKQQAKLVLFEEHFRGEIRGMIEDIRMRKGFHEDIRMQKRLHEGLPSPPDVPSERR